MPLQDVTLIPAGLDGDVSLANTGLIAKDDNGDLVQFTPQQVHDADPGPVKDSYNLNAAAGGQDSVARFTKTVTGISNNVATTVLTVTVPNAAHSAYVVVKYCAWLGAGGAVGAHEGTARAITSYTFNRVAGVNAQGGIAVILATAAQAVSGGSSLTLTAGTLSSVAGGVAETNTFTIAVTIARASGSSDNHGVFLEIEVMNVNASGVTVA